MAKVRKKNNAAKRSMNIAKGFTSGLGVAQVNEDLCHVVDLKKNCKYKTPSALLVKQFSNVAHKWTILLCVFCTESNGKRKLVTEQITLADRRYQRDLISFYKDAHRALIDECDKQMVVNDVGWIASPALDVDFDIEQSSCLLEQLGAWKQKDK